MNLTNKNKNFIQCKLSNILFLVIRYGLYLFDSKVDLFINLFEYESMDKCSLDYWVRAYIMLS